MKVLRPFVQPNFNWCGLCLLLLSGELAAGAERLFIPLLDPVSQSNVIVNVFSSHSAGESCPPQYANVLSNTNLFTPEQRATIEEVFRKYKGVTTNSGPPGAALVSFYKTNFMAAPLYRVKTNDHRIPFRTSDVWISIFQYTNSDAREEISLSTGIAAKFTNTSNDGYAVSIVRTGNGSMLTFSELKEGLATGILVRFEDLRPQGMNWDWKLADFSGGHLEEYMQMTNGMASGKWLTWNPATGGLVMDAECKEPYDWNNHRLSMP